MSGLLEEYGQRQRGGPDAAGGEDPDDEDGEGGLGGDEGEDAAEERQRQQVRACSPAPAGAGNPKGVCLRAEATLHG